MSYISKLLEVEKKYNLYEDKIDGVYYWTLSRFYIFQYGVISASAGNKKLSDKSGRTNSAFNVFIRLLKSEFQTLSSKRKGADALFLNTRREQINGEYVSPYTEGLRDHFKNVVTIEESDLSYGRKTANAKDIVYNDTLVFKGLVLRRLYKIFHKDDVRRLRKQVRERSGAALDELLAHYDTSYTTDDLIEIITGEIIRYKESKRIMKKVFDRICPKMIIEVCHYTYDKMVWNDLAHESGITVIELQHGTMHEDHVAYQYSMDAKLPILPDYVFTFSDYWNKVANLPASSTELISTGFPHFENSVVRARKENKREDDRITVIFLSQGFESQMPSIAARLAKSGTYRVIYKLHPNEFDKQKNSASELEGTSVEVAGRGRNLYDLFAVCDVQVGLFSTALYEGFGFGLRTYIFNEGMSSTMHTLVDSGYVECFSSADELLELIGRINSDKNDAVNTFWKTNALDSMKTKIDIIRRKNESGKKD